MAYSRGRNWTSEEEALLKSMGKAGAPLQEVCSRTGRSPMSVILRARLIAGIEDTTGKEKWLEGISDQSKAYSELYKNRGGNWGAGDDATLRTMFANRCSIYMIADKMDKSPTAVLERLKFLYDTPAKQEQLWEDNRKWLRFTPVNATKSKVPSIPERQKAAYNELFEIVEFLKGTKEKMAGTRPYSINVIDAIGTDENANSSILATFLRQHDDEGDYAVLKHFVKSSLGDAFSHEIVSPVIHTEEVVTDDKRIDVLVYEEDSYAIIIENKIWEAPEQNHQLANYIEGMNERGFSNDQIYIIYLPQTDEGGPSSISWNNRKKYSYEDEFSTRYRKMSFRDGILPWLQSEDFPEVKTPFFESSRQLYIDYLKGIFKQRDTDDMEQSEIQKYLTEKLGLDGNSLHDANIVARKADELKKYAEECVEILKQMKVDYLKDVFREWHRQLLADFPEYEDSIVYQESPSQYVVGIAVPYGEYEGAIQLTIEYYAQWLGCGLKYDKRYIDLKAEMQTYVSGKGLTKGMVKGSNYLYYVTKQFDECYDCLSQLINQWKNL